jgi:hypothetical protein
MISIGNEFDGRDEIISYSLRFNNIDPNDAALIQKMLSTPGRGVLNQTPLKKKPCHSESNSERAQYIGRTCQAKI